MKELESTQYGRK